MAGPKLYTGLGRKGSSTISWAILIKLEEQRHHVMKGTLYRRDTTHMQIDAMPT
jgi:hypothetical protein